MKRSFQDTSIQGFILGIGFKLVIVFLIFSIQRHYLYITIVSKSAVTTLGAITGLIITALVILITNKRFDNSLSRNIYLFFWSCVYGIGLSTIFLFTNYQLRQPIFHSVTVPITSAWPKGHDAYWISTVVYGKSSNLPLEEKFPNLTFMPSTANLIISRGYFGFEVISDIEVERKLPTRWSSLWIKADRKTLFLYRSKFGKI